MPWAARAIRRAGFAPLGRMARRWSPGWEPADDTWEPVRRALSPPGHLEAALAYYRAIPLRLPAPLRRPIATGSVAVIGDRDPFVTAAEAWAARRWFLGDYAVRVLSGGHFVQREDPRFAEVLAEIVTAAGAGPPISGEAPRAPPAPSS
jgi:hypothetical protein